MQFAVGSFNVTLQIAKFERASEQRTMVMRTHYGVLLVIIGGGLIGMISSAVAEEPPKKVPVTVTADKLDHDRTNDTYTAEGHVRIEQQDIRVEADRIMLNNRTGEAVAEGNVYLRDKGDTVMADRMEMNMNTRAGVITKGQLYKSKENIHLKGDRIERRSESA